MVYAVPLIIFMDDTSGNVSKQWNKNHVVYMSNAALPREMIDKEFCVRFVSSSPHALPMELMTALRDSIDLAAKDGVTVYDCAPKEEVLLLPYRLFWVGNNPMQAKECSQAGLTCNHFCRTCDVGGNKEEKHSDDGYNNIFSQENLRTPEDTKKEILEQLSLVRLSRATEKLKKATGNSGVRDQTTTDILHWLTELEKQLRKKKINENDIQKQLDDILSDLLGQSTLEDLINPLLGMQGVNIHLDTPTEILHTILLGVVKYFWVNTAGLGEQTLGAEYICRYKGGLIGKHFKSLAQVMPFLIYDLVPQEVLRAWTVIGDLIVLLWHTEIQDIDEYTLQARILARHSRCRTQ
ncbi:hypothetical protein C8Q75DRAFT_791117 [Abortiporus biennis]|nr:hypothetical protein C8Q75DRAFT_791117 [Abortiporus biennis]